MRSSSRDTGAGAHPVRIPWACALTTNAVKDAQGKAIEVKDLELTSSRAKRRGIPNLTIRFFCFNRTYLDTS